MEYRIEEIGGGVKACISKEHTFGTDAVLLADFAKIKRGETVCDLGSGCGIIPLLWSRMYEPLKMYGIEINADAVGQMEKAVEVNGLEEKFLPVHADMRNLQDKTLYGKMNVVSCNPPYYTLKSGAVSSKESRRTARSEAECTMSDICEIASKLLKYGGRFVMCQKPERLTDALEEMRNHGIEPKRMRFAKQSAEKGPWLVLIEGKRGGGNGLKVETDLITGKDENGEYFSEMKKIYGIGGDFE